MKKLLQESILRKMLVIFFLTLNLVKVYSQMSDPTAYTSGNSFVMNRGQVLDTSGTQHSEILYYAQAGGIDYFFDGAKVIYSLIHSDTLASTPYDTVFRMDLTQLNSNSATVIANDTSQGFINFYTAQCPNGLTDVPTYQELEYRGIYSNINLTFHLNKGFNFTYDVESGGNVNDINFKFDGATGISITQRNTLLVETSLGNIEYDIPIGAQYISSTWNAVSVSYQLSNDVVSFNAGSYNSTYPLYIKLVPVVQTTAPANLLYWSTYFGGSSVDEATDVVMDGSNNIYVVGTTYSNKFTFPYTQNGLQLFYGGQGDAWVGKFNTNRGRSWVTYYGGSYYDGGNAIGVNSTGDVYFAGETQSAPGSAIAFHLCQTCSGYHDNTINGVLWDGYIVKLNSAGQLITPSGMATFFGGDIVEEIHSLAIDLNDNLFIGGKSVIPNTNFPIVAKTGAYNQSAAYGGDENFIAEFDKYNGTTHAGNNLIWCTYIGGQTATPQEELNALATDIFGNLYATGSTSAQGTVPGNTGNYLNAPCTSNIYPGYFPIVNPGTSYPNAFLQDNHSGSVDVYVVKFNSNGAIVWSTEYGGNKDELWYQAYHNNHGIAVTYDAATSYIFITGSTRCVGCTAGNPVTGFYIKATTTTGAYNQPNYAGGTTDGYIARFNANYECDWSTLYGGAGDDVGLGIACDRNGNVWTSGFTNSNPFPPNLAITNTYTQSYGGGFDGYAGKFKVTSKELWGSYLGGTNDEINRSLAVDHDGLNLILVGVTGSLNFPWADPFPMNNIDYTDQTANGASDAYITNLYKICYGCRSSENILNENDLQNYSIKPNPGNGYFTLAADINEPAHITIFNQVGEAVLRLRVAGKNPIIDLSALTNGMYVLKVETNEQVIFSKVIINK